MRINVKNSSIVKPITETPGGTIWLSNVDLVMPASYHSHLLYFYRSNGAPNFFDAAALKAALGRALVEFYPLAGRLRKRDEDNRIEINCNAEGVLFVEADCDDATLDDFGGDFAPKAERRLIPAVDYSRGLSTFPLLLLQVTRFKCGGVCLGIANEHHVTDGVSTLHFINTWSDIARGQPIRVRPFFDRTLLSARNPPRPKFSHIELQPPPPLKAPLDHINSETTFSVFKLTRDQVNALMAKCKEDGNTKNYSTFEVVAGHVWRCACMARGLPPDQVTRVHMPVESRNRLRPPLPLGFYGNVIFSAAPIALCGEIVSNPLNFAVGKIHEAIARQDDEYLRSGLDYLELKGDVSAAERGPHLTKCPNMAIISRMKFPFYDADFGWGKPVYTGPGLAPHEGQSYVMRSPENDGSLLYVVTLLKQHMKLFEKLFYQGICHAKL